MEHSEPTPTQDAAAPDSEPSEGRPPWGSLKEKLRSPWIIALLWMPWLVLRLWPGALLHLPAGWLWWVAIAVPWVTLLLAAIGAAALWDRLDVQLSPLWVGVIVLGAVLARIWMGFLGAGSSLLQGFLTVAILGLVGHAVVTGDRAPGGTEAGSPSEASKGGARSRRLRGGAKRALAVLVTTPYLFLAPFLVMSLIWGVMDQPSTSEFLLVTGLGSFWALGLPALGIFYAFRPYRFGLPVLVTLALLPVAVGGVSWYQWEHDPQALEEARTVAERLIDQPADADAEVRVPTDDSRIARRAADALLELAATAEDDETRRRIVTGLGELGQSRAAAVYLWNLREETEGDPDRSELHRLAREAYRRVWSRLGMLATVRLGVDRMPDAGDP